MNIYHNSRKNKYRTPFGAAQISSPVTLCVDIEYDRIAEYNSVQDVLLRLWRDETGETIVKMEPVSMSGNGKVTYEATITMPELGGLLWYFFMVKINDDDGERTIYYGNNPAQTGGEGQMYAYEPPSYQITVYRHEPVPQWYKDGIVYQIFPDRFARDEAWETRCQNVLDSEKRIGGQGRTIEHDWYKPAYYEKDERGFVTSWPFYGGSFKGIEEKLDYLTSMGVSAIYLNPIFKATSNHRYDTADYMQIDPMLGTEEEFEQLVEAAKAKGIQLILDGVFSHTGADSIYFDKYGNYGGQGAFGNLDSKYRNWFEFRENDPVGYRAWWGVEDLPEVNEDEPEFRKLICGEGGVIAKWLRAGASGFRLDVADELPDSFIAEIRSRVKAEGEDNLLLGEVWEDASNKISYNERRKYFMGDELDSTMNYPVRDLLLDFMQYKTGAYEAGEQIMSLKENYPEENFYGALNLIGSHDRRRILTVMGADYNYDEAADKVRLLSVLQYCLPGVPCIYYGDEAAMTGEADPANRSGFIWDRENIGMQHHYRQLGVIYNEHPALKDGSLEMLPVGDDDVVAFVRENNEEKMLIIANRSYESKSIDNKYLREIKGAYALELLTSEEIAISDSGVRDTLEVGARTAKIICILREKPYSYDMPRGAGIICHVSSIPGGMLGAPARNFVDYLVSAGMSLWQILPLNPPGLGNSPYSGVSAFAGNPALVNYDELPSMDGYGQFCRDNEFWLDDYVDYLDSKEPLEDLKKETVKLQQYYFAVQWDELKKYANSRGIEIIGDVPVFVSADSADIWANPQLFQIDSLGARKCHAGVPPDYFSPEGQDWGNPLYDWDALKATDYEWWIKRLDQCRQRYDYVRLDHFRSFSEYYAIPEGASAKEGRWQHGPGVHFFRTIAEKLGGPNGLKIMAEDLGQLDIGVWNLLKLTGFPGMNVWQFSYDEMRAMDSEQIKSRVFYTGTHDNQTLMGWCKDNEMDTHDALAIIREMYESDAPWVMLQLQDMFMMGDEARMNVPGIAEGNWTWRVPGKSMEEGLDHAKAVAAAYRILAIETQRIENPMTMDFLKKHKIYVDDFDKKQILEDMISYYEDKISSGTIKGIPYTPVEGDRKVIAIDAGDTNVRVARAAITGHEITWEKLARTGLPGKTEEVTLEEMFSQIASMVATVDRDGECAGIGMNYSFPGEPTDDMDITISELMSKALRRIGQPARRVATVNDAVATLLSGSFIKTKGNPVAGFVLGNGANICILDKNNIIYNLESASYPNLPSGDIDKKLDSESINPGEALAEKLICGTYLQTLIASMAEAAVNEGLASPDMSGAIDKSVMAEIEAACIKRATLYAAIMVVAAIRLSGFEGAECTVITEDSVFWDFAGIRDNVKKYVEELLDGVVIDFAKAEDSSLIGSAAVAASK